MRALRGRFGSEREVAKWGVRRAGGSGGVAAPSRARRAELKPWEPLFSDGSLGSSSAAIGQLGRLEWTS
jgi:hypothetical protein